MKLKHFLLALITTMLLSTLVGPAQAGPAPDNPTPTVLVFLHVDGLGKPYHVKKGSTLQELLEKLDIEIGPDDTVSQEVDTKVEDNSLVSIKRLTKVLDSKTHEVPFEEIKSVDLVECDSGETNKVVKEGAPGERVEVSVISYGDFVPLKVETISDEVSKDPIPEVKADCKPEVLAETVEASTPVDAPVITGSKSDWMRAAGIPEDQWPSADILVTRESGWDPNAVNSSSGACSLVQSLPCSKIPGNWRDPVTALTWGNGYVSQRYGSWDAALQHSYSKGYY